MKVLIVEDEELAVKKLIKTLTAVDPDAEVVGVAESIMATVKWINSNPLPDLILMDMGLPVLDGWEATRRIKAEPATSGIPVVALTANAMTGHRENALAAGCDDFDTKPVDMTRLLGKIQALLR